MMKGKGLGLFSGVMGLIGFNWGLRSETVLMSANCEREVNFS